MSCSSAHGVKIGPNNTRTPIEVAHEAAARVIVVLIPGSKMWLGSDTGPRKWVLLYGQHVLIVAQSRRDGCGRKGSAPGRGKRRKWHARLTRLGGCRGSPLISRKSTVARGPCANSANNLVSDC